MPIGVKLSHWFGARIVCLSGSLTIALAVYISSFLTNFTALLIVYGIIFGFASGIVYVIPMDCGWKYFPHKKGTSIYINKNLNQMSIGMVNGAILGAFGFGTFIFNYVALAIANPHNLPTTVKADGTKLFEASIYEKVPLMFQILAGCYLILGIGGSLLIKSPKSNISRIVSMKYLSYSNKLSRTTKRGSE